MVTIFAIPSSYRPILLLLCIIIRMMYDTNAMIRFATTAAATSNNVVFVVDNDDDAMVADTLDGLGLVVVDTMDDSTMTQRRILLQQMSATTTTTTTTTSSSGESLLSSLLFVQQFTFTNAPCQQGYFIGSTREQQQQPSLSPSQPIPSQLLLIMNTSSYTDCDPMIGIRRRTAGRVDTAVSSNHRSSGDDDHATSVVVSQFTIKDIVSSLLLFQRHDDTDDDTSNEKESGGEIENGSENENGSAAVVSLELWIRVPSVLSSEMIPILTIGQYRQSTTNGTVHVDRNSNDDDAINESSDVCDTANHHVDLQLSYTSVTIHMQNSRTNPHHQWTITYATTTDGGETKSCRTVTSTSATSTTTNSSNQTLPVSSLIHVVLSIHDQNQVVLYVNGRPVISTKTTTTATSNDWWWHPDSKIHLLGFDDATTSTSSSNDTTSNPTTVGTKLAQDEISLYQFSIYSTTAMQQQEDDEEGKHFVQSLILDNTLPSTPPFAYNQSITVYEDAESVPGIHYNNNDISWYRTVPSSVLLSSNDDIAYLNGPHIIDLDRDVQAVIYDTATTFPEMLKQQFPTLQPIYMYIVELPLQGQLYFHDGINGNPISSMSSTKNKSHSLVFIPIGLYDTNAPKLKYVPPHDAISHPNAYTSFRYCISTGTSMIFDIHQCQSVATVTIVIMPVNDPPIAFPVSIVRVREAVVVSGVTNDTSSNNHFKYDARVPKIQLHGSDVDLDDTIDAIQIVSVPQMGYLSLVVSSFRRDLLLHGTRLYMNTTVASNIEDPVYVQYTFDRNMTSTSNVIVQNNDVKDYFTFRVRDQQGVWSMEERVEIQVISALVAFADPIVRLTEDDSIQSLRWYGSSQQRPTQFYIEKIPSQEVGILIHPLTNATITKPGMIIMEPSIVANVLNMRFQLTPNFCHPNTNSTQLPPSYDNEVRFRIISYVYSTNAATAAKQVDSVSDPFTQQLQIECRLDTIEFSVPDKIAAGQSIVVSSLQQTTTDPCHARQWINQSSNFVALNNDDDESTTSCQSAAIMSGITLSSVDQKASMVTVSIAPKIGLITMNPLYWNLSDPLLGRPVLSTGTIVFRAYPDDDVTLILSHLHYQSFIIGNDTIDFTIQYGNCTIYDDIFMQQRQDVDVESLLNSSLWTSSATCQVLRRSIPVEVLPDSSPSNRYSKSQQWNAKFPWQIPFCLIVYPMLYITYVHLELWSHHRGEMNNDNNKTVVANGNGDDDSSILLDTTMTPPQLLHGGGGDASSSDALVEQYCIQHEDEHGMIYYEDTRSGTTHWSIPSSSSSPHHAAHNNNSNAQDDDDDKKLEPPSIRQFL